MGGVASAWKTVTRSPSSAPATTEWTWCETPRMQSKIMNLGRDERIPWQKKRVMSEGSIGGAISRRNESDRLMRRSSFTLSIAPAPATLELVRKLVGGPILIFTQRSGVKFGIAPGNSGS